MPRLTTESQDRVQVMYQEIRYHLTQNSGTVKAVLLLLAALALQRFGNANPLADGRIPAGEVPPHEHWNRLVNDDEFSMRNLGLTWANATRAPANAP